MYIAPQLPGVLGVHKTPGPKLIHNNRPIAELFGTFFLNIIMGTIYYTSDQNEKCLDYRSIIIQ
jgi:hypothetical protein